MPIYICPLSFDAPRVPVITNEGITYDFTWIARSLLRENPDPDRAFNSALDPSTNGAIDTLIYNRAAKILNDALMDEVLPLSHEEKTEIALIYTQLIGRYPAIKIYGVHTLDGMQALIGAPMPASQLVPQPAVIVESLWDATCNGHSPVVIALLAAGADINQTNTRGTTLLYIAAQQGHLDVVTALLDAGANTNRGRPNGQTPLLVAAAEGHLDVVMALLAAGANPNLTGIDGITPLHCAAAKGHTSVVTTLLSNPRVDPNPVMPEGATPLNVAVLSEHILVVMALLGDLRVDPNLATTDGATPLHHAINKGLAPVVTALLSNPRIISTQVMIDGTTPLLLAAKKGHLPIVAALLAADPRMHHNQATMTDSTTQLYIAILFGHLEVTKALLRHQMATITHCRLYTAALNGYPALVHATLSDVAIRDYYLNKIIKNPEFMRDALRQNTVLFTELATHRNELWARLRGPEHFNLPPDEHEALLNAILHSGQAPDESLRHPLHALFTAPLTPQPKGWLSLFSRTVNITLNDIQAYADATYSQPAPSMN